MPQLRILATSFCGKKCIYCRPSGEGTADCKDNLFVDYSMALKICSLYKFYGGNDIKISGGDPIFWPKIVSFIHEAKHEIGIRYIELITRSPKVIELVHDLKNAGLDTLNFSLDVIDPAKYQLITGVNDHDELLETIKACTKILPTKINSVIMKGINHNNVDELIDFCEEIGARQLKLLDIIDDLQDCPSDNCDRLRKLGFSNLKDLFVPLEKMSEAISKRSISSSITYQGGLGHPMNEFVMHSGLVVTIKDSTNGAWYGDICKNCCHYPCHDALMALRYTPENKLQFCLLNEAASISLDGTTENEMAQRFCDALSIYENASFHV